MDSKILYRLQNIETLLNELKCMEHLLEKIISLNERIATSNEHIEQLYQGALNAYQKETHTKRRVTKEVVR